MCDENRRYCEFTESHKKLICEKVGITFNRENCWKDFTRSEKFAILFHSNEPRLNA